MPTPVSAGSIISYTIRGVLNNQEVMSVFHYKMIGAAAPDITLLMDGVNAVLGAAGSLYARWIDYVNNALVSVKTRIQVIYPVRYAYFEYTQALTVGQGAGLAAPQNVSAAITRRGVDAGRGNIGTIHMPGVNANDIGSGNIVGGAIAKLTLIGSESNVTRASGVAGVDILPILYKRSAPGASVPPVSFIVQSSSRVERRRTVGLGA